MYFTSLHFTSDRDFFALPLCPHRPSETTVDLCFGGKGLGMWNRLLTSI